MINLVKLDRKRKNKTRYWKESYVKQFHLQTKCLHFVWQRDWTSKAPPNKTLTTQTLDNIIIFKCSAWRSGFALIMTFVRTSLKTRLEMNITKYDNNQLHQGMWRRAESKRKQSSEDVESMNPPFWDMIIVKKYENVFTFIYLELSRSLHIN